MHKPCSGRRYIEATRLFFPSHRFGTSYAHNYCLYVRGGSVMLPVPPPARNFWVWTVLFVPVMSRPAVRFLPTKWRDNCCVVSLCTSSGFSNPEVALLHGWCHFEAVAHVSFSNTFSRPAGRSVLRMTVTTKDWVNRPRPFTAAYKQINEVVNLWSCSADSQQQVSHVTSESYIPPCNYKLLLHS